MCKFGSSDASTVVFQSANQVLCTAPSGTADTTVEVEISSMDEVYTTWRVEYTYKSQAATSAIYPTSGSTTTTGTVVVVTGTNFVNSDLLMCWWTIAGAQQKKEAGWISEFQVFCTTPTSSGSSTATVHVTNNDVDTPGGSQQTFTYRAPSVASSIAPTEGPVQGGNAVVISASNSEPGEMMCRFGMYLFDATTSSGSTVTCTVPQTSAVGTVQVTVGNVADTTYWESSAAGATYTYVEEPVVTGVAMEESPSTTNPDGSGNVLLMVSGTNFMNRGTARCRYDGSSASTATFVSATRVLCLIPASKLNGACGSFSPPSFSPVAAFPSRSH